MRFRLNASRLFLTYSRCPEWWTKEFVRDKLVNEILVNKRGKEKYKTKVKAYVIAQERHGKKIGEGEYERGNHFHCLLELEKKVNIENERELDVEEIHGNYQSVKNVWSVLNYVKKHGDWIGKGFPGMRDMDRNVLMAINEEEAKMILMPKLSVRDKLAFREEYQRKIKIKETNIKEIEIEGLQFQKDLEPYLKQLIGSGKSGFNLKERPMGIIVYGEPKSGKSTWLYKLGQLLGESKRSFNEFRTMSSSYKNETIIMLDEFEGKEFKKYAKQLKMMITDEYCHTLGFNETKQLIWPRRVLICTNEDVEEWEWIEGLKERFMVIKVGKDGGYQIKLWEENKLVNKRLEEAMEGLGFEIKEVKEMKLDELRKISIN